MMKKNKFLTGLFFFMVLSFCCNNLTAQKYVNIDCISNYIGPIIVEAYQTPSRVISSNTTMINKQGLTPLTISLPEEFQVNCIVKITIPSTGYSSTYNVFDIPGHIVAVIHSNKSISMIDANTYYNAGGGGKPGGGGNNPIKEL